MTYRFIDLFIIAVIFFISFGIGASLRFGQIGEAFSRPRALFCGIGLQILGLPLLAFTVAAFSGFPPELRTGLVILAACPGGTTCGFISYLVKADTALSVSMTSLNSIISLFTIPIFVNLACLLFMGDSGRFVLPFLNTFIQIVLVVIFPLALGMFFHLYARRQADRMRNLFKSGSVLLLGTMYAIKLLASEKHGGSGLDMQTALQVLPAVLALHMAGLILGFGVARLARVAYRSAVTIGLEVGLQNTTLAVLVAGTFLDNQIMTQPAVVYALFSFWTSLLFGWGMQRIAPYGRLRGSGI